MGGIRRTLEEGQLPPTQTGPNVAPQAGAYPGFFQGGARDRIYENKV